MPHAKAAAILYTAGAACGATYGFGGGQGFAAAAVALVLVALFIVRKDL